MTDQNNTAAKKPKNNNRNRKNNRYKKKKSGDKSQVKAQGNASGQESGTTSTKKRNSNRNRRPKALTPARILQKYDNLLEQHLIARRKFSEVHGRFSGKQLQKVVNNLEKTRKNLYEYESTLDKDWQKEIIKQRVDLYPSDRQFSSTHDLEPIGDEVSFEGDFEDPHLLPTQKSEDWQADTEESVGTFEDYEKYKQSI